MNNNKFLQENGLQSKSVFFTVVLFEYHQFIQRKVLYKDAANLGVQIFTQLQFFGFSKNLPEVLGEERAARIMVTREWLDAGINVALGSDTPTSPWQDPQPTLTLRGAVQRVDGNGDPYHTDQEMTIQEALHAHTMGSAHAAFEENNKGSLSPGKFANRGGHRL